MNSQNITYTYRDQWGDSELDAETLEDARSAAEDLIRQGDYGSPQKTIWVEGHVTWEDADGNEQSESVTVQIDPEEPECSNGEHSWQAPYALLGGLAENPGVWGHGGGTISTDICTHCGCRRTEDSWAQNPATGEQGLESVEYEPGLYEVEDHDADEDGDWAVTIDGQPFYREQNGHLGIPSSGMRMGAYVLRDGAWTEEE